MSFSGVFNGLYIVGIGLYELPGGNLDFGEDIFACVQREALEETGLKIKAKKVIAYTNDVQKEANKHEVTLYVLCEREDASQQPEVRAEAPEPIDIPTSVFGGPIYLSAN